MWGSMPVSRSYLIATRGCKNQLERFPQDHVQELSNHLSWRLQKRSPRTKGQWQWCRIQSWVLKLSATIRLNICPCHVWEPFGFPEQLSQRPIFQLKQLWKAITRERPLKSFIISSSCLFCGETSCCISIGNLVGVKPKKKQCYGGGKAKFGLQSISLFATLILRTISKQRASWKTWKIRA